jgi:hypothetical protein
MNWTKRCALLVALLAISPIHAQDIETKQREGLAYSRLGAAKQTPAVTHAQCSAMLTEWQQRDKGDRSNSTFWFERLSTEELTRLSRMALACEQEDYQRYRHREDYGEALRFAMYALQFHSQLLFRAETVLHDHALIEEYFFHP